MSEDTEVAVIACVREFVVAGLRFRAERVRTLAFQRKRPRAMRRVIILIGVTNTPSPALRDLEAVESSVGAMASWAREQGFQKDDIVTLTDCDAPLLVRSIQESIGSFIKDGDVDQLIVYFSGHGVLVGLSEFWLLSDARKYPNEAVNVAGSVEAARYCGIHHVVFISDACRTAASGLNLQALQGSFIFPTPTSSVEKPVDQFFATALGDPAHEVPNDDETYGAIYTETLVSGLRFQVKECIQIRESGGRKAEFVCPDPLDNYLTATVPKLLVARGVTRSQVPIARLTSRSDAWLATRDYEGSNGAPAADWITHAISRPSNHLIVPGVRTGFEGASSGHGMFSLDAVDDDLDRILKLPEETLERLEEQAEADAASFGVHFDDFGIDTGFIIRGDEFQDWTTGEKVNCDSKAFTQIRLEVEKQASVVLRFSTGSGAILPAVPHYIGALTVRDGLLIDVAYMRSDRQSGGRGRAIGRLHGLMSAATRAGIFQPSGSGIAGLRQLVSQYGREDLSLLLFASYALYNLQQLPKIRFLQQDMMAWCGASFFDLGMLGEARKVPLEFRTATQTPLLSMGWPLLVARGYNLPASLTRLPETLIPALWSTFKSEGVTMLDSAIRAGEIL
jgi:hypothetical protein